MINIQFKRAIMHNFLCFEHSEVILNNLGYTIVSGKNNRTIDNAISNGSGKSSVFNAISFALTGETIQGLSKNLENIYADPTDCWVELELSINNDNFVIKRAKTPKQDLKISVNGIDRSGKGIKESTQVLAKYLPDLTSMLLGSVIILGQGMPCKFTEGHPGLRKEKLEKLTKSDYMIQSVRTKLDDRKLELSNQLRSHEDSRVSLNTQLQMSLKQLEKTEIELKEFDEYAKDGSLDNVLGEIQLQLADLNADLAKNSEEQEKLKISKETEVEAFDANKASLEQAKLEELEEPQDRLNFLNEKQIGLKAQIKSELARLKKLDAVTDVCPTCGQKLIGVTKIDTTKDWEYVHDLETEMHNIGEQLKEPKALISSINKKYQIKLDTLNESFKANTQRISEYLNTAESAAKQLNTEILNLVQQQSRLTALEQNYAKLVKDQKGLLTTINGLQEQLLNIESLVVTDNEHLQVLTNLISLAKREFRGILLENVINYINQRVSYYSKEVFDSDVLSFNLNENYIDIMYDGKYYEALSGGEKQKVDIIIQLALRDLLSTQLGITSNILVVDEIFDFLDSKGCQKILNVITNLTNIESVFIISHHINDLSISYDNELLVEKGENGISHIIAH